MQSITDFPEASLLCWRCEADAPCAVPQQHLERSTPAGRLSALTEEAEKEEFKRKMSVAVKRGSSGPKSKCAARLWRLFPHLFLCLSLVAYAALGALVFEQVEGKNKSNELEVDFHTFLGEIVNSIQNRSRKWLETLSNRLQGDRILHSVAFLC